MENSSYILLAWDANIFLLTNKGSNIIKYQLIQTCALINCNRVYFRMKLDYTSKENYIIPIIYRPIMFWYNILNDIFWLNSFINFSVVRELFP